MSWQVSLWESDPLAALPTLMLPGEITAQDLHTLVTDQLGIARPSLCFTLHTSTLTQVPINRTLLEAISQSSLSVDRESILSIEFFDSSITDPKQESSISIPDWISCLAPDNQGSLLIGSYDCKSRLLKSNAITVSPFASEGPIKALCWMGGGDEFAIASMEKKITKCSLERGKLDSFSVPSIPSSLCYSASTKTLAYALWDGSVQFKCANEESLVACSHTGKATSVAFSASEQLISAGWDSKVRITDLSIQKQSQIINLSAGVNSFCLPSENTIFAGLTNNRPELIDSRSTKANILKFGNVHKGWVTAVASKNDHLLATASTDCTVRLWDLRGDTKSSIFALQLKAKPLAVAFIDDGQRLVCGGEDNLLSLYTLT